MSSPVCSSWLRGKGCLYAKDCWFHHDVSLNEFNTCSRHGCRKPCKPNCYRLPFGHQVEIPGPRHSSNYNSAGSASQPQRHEQTHSRSRSPRLSKNMAVQTDNPQDGSKYSTKDILSGYLSEWRSLPTPQDRKQYKQTLLRTFHTDKWGRGTSSRTQTQFAIEITQEILSTMQ